MVETTVTDSKDTGALLRKLVSDIWWIVLLRGVALLVLGVMLMYRPLLTIAVFIEFLGFYWLVEGLLILIECVRGRATMAHWGRGILVGILLMLAALFIISRPVLSGIISQVVQVYIVAIMVFLSGLTSIVTGIRLRKEIDNEWSMILGGLFSVMLSILLLSSPLMSALILLRIAGMSSIVLGLFLIYVAFRIRKLSAP